ncbi:MAG: glycoside hydrolase family 172 protein [Planctomycetota bacterium]
MRQAIGIAGFVAWVLFSGRAPAQIPGTDLLRALERPPEFEARRASSADPNWRDGNADCRPIAPGKTLTLAELEGPGRIVHIWFTIAAEDPQYPRTMTLRIYWDGDEDPAVESPIGDFFAVGHGVDVPVNSLPVQVSSDGRARNCYWPMPFRKSARIVVSNDSPDKRVGCIYWTIDWQKLPSLPEDTMYFHAQYRQEFPCRSGEDYLILDAEGEGVYAGTVLSVQADEDSWFGEGDDRFYVDGEEEPSLRGTGTEDYFSDAWGFRQFDHPFYGVSLWEGYDADDRGTAYRWHVPDPVRFQKSLRVTIEHKGVLFHPDGRVKTGFGERADHFSSVAFWYQKGKAKRFAAVPPAPDRLVRYEAVEAESLVSSARAEPGKLEVQRVGSASGGSQLFFTPPSKDAWLEVPIEVSEDGRYVLKADLTRSWDYGIYQISVDGRALGGPRNLHSPAIAVREEKLGTAQLTKGAHVLRFSCVGSAPESKVRGTGEQGRYLGIDRIRFRKLAIPRD